MIGNFNFRKIYNRINNQTYLIYGKNIKINKDHTYISNLASFDRWVVKWLQENVSKWWLNYVINKKSERPRKKKIEEDLHKLNMKDYIALGRIFENHNIRYNKKKDEFIKIK